MVSSSDSLGLIDSRSRTWATRLIPVDRRIASHLVKIDSTNLLPTNRRDNVEFANDIIRFSHSLNKTMTVSINQYEICLLFFISIDENV